MSYTAVLWLLIIEHVASIGALVFLWVRVIYPRFKEIIINQKTLADNDKAIHTHVELARSAAMQSRDHGADTKQSIETLNGLVKEVVRNLPKSGSVG